MKRKLIFAFAMGVVLASCQNEDIRPVSESENSNNPITIVEGQGDRPKPGTRPSVKGEDMHILNNERSVENY